MGVCHHVGERGQKLMLSFIQGIMHESILMLISTSSVRSNGAEQHVVCRRAKSARSVTFMVLLHGDTSRLLTGGCVHLTSIRLQQWRLRIAVKQE